ITPTKRLGERKIIQPPQKEDNWIIRGKMKLKSKISMTMAFILMLIALFIVILISATVGSADLSTIDSFKIMMSEIPIIGDLIHMDIESKYITIVMNIRLPRILLATIVGTGLAAVGCVFQGIFKNPMADPYVLGVSSGAAFGATIGLIFSYLGLINHTIIINALAFGGALITMFVVYNIARIGSKVPTVTLLLAGIAMSFFLQSCISILMIFNRDQIEDIVYWTMGSVSTASWQEVFILAPIILVGVFVIYAFSRELNTMLLGEEHAKNLGVEIESVKKILLGISSFLIAAIVSVSGIIGFVGLIVPHAIRMLVGPNHKVLIPFSVVAGGIFLVICDSLARTIANPMEIPVGAVTAVFGAPYFLYLLYRKKRA
ncbi:FecCD family ABC transporter permease, partial [Vallitalea okinawensis]|uniref:FecCD family ABC transporter permease n=1 Tax=Vallitalea okinawensis TaxID=2078660 RepID=UPI002E8E334B